MKRPVEYLWSQPVGPVSATVLLLVLLAAAVWDVRALSTALARYESANPVAAQDARPPRVDPTAQPTAADTSRAGNRIVVGCKGDRGSCEVALLSIVLLAGGLGGLLHTLRSLVQYIGNRELVWSWVPQYVVVPVTGAMLSVVLYLLVRAGFVGFANVSEVTPYGFAAAGTLAGMFSQTVIEKLKAVAETMFTRPPRGRDALSTEDGVGAGTALADPEALLPQVPIVTSAVVRARDNERVLVIAGQGLSARTQVLINELPYPAHVEGLTIVVKLAAELAAATKPLRLLLTNVSPDGKQTAKGREFTVSAEGPSQ